jgi:acyl-CoA thioester hydrolase
VTRHVVEVQPRWADLDAFGHVNNVTWLEYLQEARVDMLFVHAPREGAEQLAEGVVVARAEIEYHKPLQFRQRPVRIEMWVSRIGNSSFTIAYDVVDLEPDGSQVRYVSAATVLVPVDPATGRPRRVSPPERGVLEVFVE